MQDKLRIGILTDSYILPSWSYEAVKEIFQSDSSIIALLIINDSPIPDNSRKGAQAPLMYRLHRKADRMIFKAKPDYSAKRDLRVLLKDIPQVKIKFEQDEKDRGIDEKDLVNLRKYNLDVILNLGCGRVKGKILSLPKFGIWSYPMDNYGIVAGGTSGYYEVVNRNPVTPSALVKHGETSEKDQILACALESTCTYSVNLTRNKLFRRASQFPLRVLNGIYREGENHILKLSEKYSDKKFLEEVNYVPPSVSDSLRNLVIAKIIFLSKIFKKIRFTDPFTWRLLFQIGDPDNFLRADYKKFRVLMPGKDKFWADPFVVAKDGNYYVFVEEFIYSINKAHLSVLELNSSGEIQNVGKIIERPYHMSYPFIFEQGGEFLMIPETGENNTIDLYRCVDFPGRWEYVKTLMSGLKAYDTTLFRYKDKWWLFTLLDTINSSLDGSPELFLFYSDDFMSDNWISHPLNPVVSDIRTARPAGKIFVSDGRIYRPSQDCAGRYGNSFTINQILTLTESEYKEIQVTKVKPDWDKQLQGAHTFNISEDFTIIDAYSFRKRVF